MTDSRRIRRLHLHAAREEDARRGAILIEDAIRTASFPDSDAGRLLVIRRLKLGRIPCHASPGSVALQVESAVRILNASAVRFNSQSAAWADVVAFHDHASAIDELARRHAQRASTSEWFWKEVVPEWDDALSRERRWIALLDVVMQLPAVAPLMGAVVFRAVSHGVHHELIQAVSSERARALLSAAGWTYRPHGIASDADGRVAEAPLTSAIAADLPNDVRAVWLLTFLAVHQNAARAADPDLPSRVQSRLWQLRRREGAAGRPAVETPTGASAPDGGTSMGRESEPAATIRRQEDVSAPYHRGADRDASASGDAAAAAPSAAERPVKPAGPPGSAEDGRHFAFRTLADGAATACAGLFYVVPLLDRFGMGEWTEREPRLLDTAYPARLLVHIALAEDAPPQDTVLSVLTELANQEPLPEDVELPEVVRRMCEGTKPGQSSFDYWLAAVRRWCSVTADLELTDLILRPGKISCSPTHVDVYFDFNQIDVRVRHHGLDIDPGWLPWLGRVVLFHYT